MYTCAPKVACGAWGEALVHQHILTKGGELAQW